MVQRQTSVDLLNQTSDWGVTVSEAKAKRGSGARLLLLGGYALMGIAAVLVLPILAGLLLFPDSNGILHEFAIVAFCVVLGMAFKFQAGKLPRNALQIDYRANEIRLGAQKSNGVFIRERVCGFRQIEHVQVEKDASGSPTLTLTIDGDVFSVRFNETDLESVRDLGAKISAARESAMRAPVRSRIQSRIMGLEASFREVKSRIQSRAVT